MLSEITTTQEIADQLRPLVEQAPDDSERQIALDALQELERTGWHPLPFMWARRSVPGTFHVDSSKTIRYEPPPDRPTFGAAAAIIRLVLAYSAELNYLSNKRRIMADQAKSASE